MKTYLFALIALFAFFSSNQQKNKITKTKVIIAGKILNHEKYPDNYTVKLFVNNLVILLGETQIASIDETGNFKFQVKVEYPQKMYLTYGKMISLYVSPGDSLHVQFDADEFIRQDEKNYYPNSTLIFSGDDATLNNEINLFRVQTLSKEKSRVATENESKMQPFEYRDFLMDQREKESDALDSFIKQENPSEQFIKLTKLENLYGTAFKLIHYTWYNPFINKKNKTALYFLELPDSYYKFLDEVKIDEEEAKSCFEYKSFLHEYYMYKTFTPSRFYALSDSLKGKFSKSKEFIPAYKDLLNTVKTHYTGIVKEVLLSQELYNLLNSFKRADVFEVLYPNFKDQIRGSFQEMLDKKYMEVKLTAQNPATNISLQKEEKNTKTMDNDIFNEILEKNKGKVIYIDFWATWCGPCLGEFPISVKLHKKLEGKNVELVYLCVKSDKVKWEKTLSDYNLEGSHYFLNDSQFDILSVKFQITGIPHYVLIDKQGNVIDQDAPRPSSGEELTDLISQYLN